MQGAGGSRQPRWAELTSNDGARGGGDHCHTVTHHRPIMPTSRLTVASAPSLRIPSSSSPASPPASPPVPPPPCPPACAPPPLSCSSRFVSLVTDEDEHGGPPHRDTGNLHRVRGSTTQHRVPGARLLARTATAAKLPVEALAEAELRRWVVKPGHVVPKLVHPPPGVNSSVYAYESSHMELQWLIGTRKGGLCAHANDPAVTAAAQTWIDYSSQPGVWRPGRRPPVEPSAAQAEVLSHFVVTIDGRRHRQPIEPLHGVARHPFGVNACAKDASGHSTNLFDMTYLVAHNDCGRQSKTRAKPRVVLFDMGVSQGFKGIPGGIPATVHAGAGIGPSMPLFYRLYQDRCLEPDAVFAWEIDKHISNSDWWGDAGPDIRRKVRFFEVPVTRDRGGAARCRGRGTPPGFVPTDAQGRGHARRLCGGEARH